MARSAQLASVGGIDQEGAMPGWKTRWASVVLLVSVCAGSGCQAIDRAGGSADVQATELRFGVTGAVPTQITAWANDVDQLSKGSMKVTFIRDARAQQADYEAATIADVRAGTVEMAWVGARAFDKVGVTTFQPLLAPLLIDSLELEDDVFDAGLPQQMMTGLKQVDLVGVGVLPGPMRKLLGVSKSFATPTDFAGQTVGIQASAVAEQTFQALGAVSKAIPPSANLTGLDAYEQQLASIEGNHYADQAESVTGNLNLWPRPLVIIANQAAFQRLTDDQRAVLTAASQAAIPVAMEAERAADANATTALCKAGLTFALSSNADLAAIQMAVDPVVRSIGEEPGNSSALDQITTLKNALHRAPDTAGCGRTAADPRPATRYDGVYRRTVNWATVEPCPDDAPRGDGVRVDELTLSNGSLQLWNWAEGHEDEREIGWDGTYSVFNDQLVIEDSSARLTVDLRLDGKTLTMSNLRGGACGDARAWTTKNWVRQ